MWTTCARICDWRWDELGSVDDVLACKRSVRSQNDLTKWIDERHVEVLKKAGLTENVPMKRTLDEADCRIPLAGFSSVCQTDADRSVAIPKDASAEAPCFAFRSICQIDSESNGFVGWQDGVVRPCIEESITDDSSCRSAEDGGEDWIETMLDASQRIDGPMHSHLHEWKMESHAQSLSTPELLAMPTARETGALGPTAK